MGIGIEPEGILEAGPYVSVPATAIASPVVGYPLAAPSYLECECEGGTDNTGKITITGVRNGATDTEDFDFVGPGGAGKITLKGGKLWDEVTSIAADVDLTGEVAVPTIGIRVSDRVYLDYMTESIGGKNNIIKTDKNVRSRHSRKSQAGLWSDSGDFDFNLEPENGLGELLKLCFGDPTTTPKDGATLETGLGIGSETPSTQPSTTKRLILEVNSVTGSDDITISGDVNGTPDTEDIAISGAGTYYSLKSFDSVTDYTAGGSITAIDYDVKQADSYDHVYIPCDSLPSFFARFGKKFAEREVQGLKINKGEFSFKTEESVVAKMSADGRTEQENDIAVPSFSDLDFFVFHQSSISRGGSPFHLPMELVLTQTNTLNLRKRLGSRFIRDIEVEGGETGMAFKFLFESTEEYRRFWGSSVATSPLNSLTSQDIEILLTSFEEIFSGGDKYALKIEIPEAYIEEMSENVNSRDVIESTGTMYLEEDAAENTTVKLTLTNGIPAY